MKIALCLHGLSDGINDKRPSPIMYDLGYKFIKTELLDKYPGEIDVFCHTWNYESKDKIIRDYAPKKYIIGEPRIHVTSRPRQASCLYSYMRANQLRKEYEAEQGFKYDCIVTTRYDPMFHIKIDIRTMDMTKFNIPGNYKAPEQDLDHLVNYRNFLEWILISNGDLMDKWCNFYNVLPKMITESAAWTITKTAEDGLKRTIDNPHHIFMTYVIHPDTGLRDHLKLFTMDEIACCSVFCMTVTGKYDFKNFQERFPCFKGIDYIV